MTTSHEARRALLITLWAIPSALQMAHAADAERFPSKPVRIIVPYAAGGTADALIRILSPVLEKRWGQPVVVDFKPGGGTVIGTAAAATAVPDGYTLLVAANSLVINAKLNKTLSYDHAKSFDPVALLVNSPQVLAVGSASPYGSLSEFLKAARAAPGALTYSSVGPASTQHIAGEMLWQSAGVSLIFVPYAGGKQAVNAVLGGHVAAVLTNVSDVKGLLEAGKLRALAVTTPERLDELRDVPTVAESGYRDYEAVVWFGIVAPAGTPAAAVNTLASGFEASLSDASVRQQLLAAGLQPAYLGPGDMASHLRMKFEHYSRVIDRAKIRAE